MNRNVSERVHVKATHLTSEQVHADVRSVLAEAVNEISDATAVTIASWWQSSGTSGSALAALASGAPTDVKALLKDLSDAFESVDKPSADYDALNCFGTWVLQFVESPYRKARV